jgi:multiple sugar transport system substrate-binding protein
LCVSFVKQPVCYSEKQAVFHDTDAPFEMERVFHVVDPLRKPSIMASHDHFAVAFLGQKRHLLAILLGVATLFFAGCPTNTPDAKKQLDAKPFKGIKLRLAVVDDAALATAIGRLAGEWNAQTESELKVESMTAKDLEASSSLEPDVVIAPASLFGTLAEKNLLVTVPETIRNDAQWNSLFDLLKLREVSWGKSANKSSLDDPSKTDTIKAVPFGSPVFVCYYRADLLEKVGRRPPQTWEEYQELAKLLSSQKPSGDGPWCGVIEPLAPGWAGLTLLARAASYAKHRDNISTLFKVDTMEPLLTTPAFVRALEELVAATKTGAADPLASDPQAVRAAFWKGQCGLALTWPSAAQELQNGDAAATNPASTNTDSTISAGVVELPGAKKVYNRTTQKWDIRSDEDNIHVPLLDIVGRLGMVSKQSQQTEAAFRLLLWLSDSERSPVVSAVSPDTTVFNRSQMQAMDRWVEKSMPANTASQYAAITENTLCGEQWLTAIPLPGRAEYLAVLDEAVRAAVRGEKTPENALAEAAAQWQKITERLGLDLQRTAYQHSLGW